MTIPAASPGEPYDNVSPLFPEGWDQAEPPAEPVDVWDSPIPLGQAHNLPPFPTKALPGWLGDMVGAVAEETQTPADLAGGMGLAALSTACGGRAVIAVRGRWREPVNLYIVIALPPGNRKSAVVAEMTRPMLTVEKTLIETNVKVRAEAETTAKLAKTAAEKAAAKAANASGDERAKLTAEAIDLAQAAENVQIPARPQLIADDVTPEGLASLLAEQGGRMAVISAEGGIFDIIAGRYSGTPNLEVFLKGHAADLLRVNRQGRDPQFLEAPALTMGLAVQPSVFRDIAKSKGFSDRGLLARFLYALPKSMVGYRNIKPDLIPDTVANAYAENLKDLVTTMAEWTDPAVLTLSPDANDVLLAHQDRTEKAQRPGAALSGMDLDKWAPKLDGTVCRIAGLLHLATHSAAGITTPISGETMTSAAAIGAYYTAHALAVFDAMGSDAHLAKARTALAWLVANPRDNISRRELFNALPRADFPTVADLDPALTLLEDHGWIRELPTPVPSRKGGRPKSPRYQTHPAARQLTS
ncbi:YfjI family protein [Kitasatospora sp. NPDC101183]|uniref:YfjI family protein n=1 Tax=Kitasatospora sp. NPDC101183 TaxID=3364100 RepID=UPI00381BBF84